MLPLHVCETIQEEMDKNPELAQEDYPGQRFVDHKAAEELMRKVMKQSRLDYEAEQAAEQAVRTAPAAAIIIIDEEMPDNETTTFQ
jgi:ferredoxin